MSQAEGTLAGAVLAAQAARRRVRTINGLRDAASRVCTNARARGFDYLAAASPDGAALVGAASILSDGELVPVDDTCHDMSDMNILVIEAVAISHMIVDARVAELEDRGCKNINVFVCHDFRSTFSTRVAADTDITTLQAL